MELWMSIIGLSMVFGGLPQAYRIWKRKTSGDISIIFWVIMINGLAWWFYYGILIRSISLIITNGTGLLLDLLILLVIIKYRKRRLIKR